MIPPFPCCPMDESLAQKPSECTTSSSESTAVVPDESGCGSCIVNFLHLRPQHALDAVVDDITKKDEDDDYADMMMMEANDDDDRVMMIDASMSLSQEDNNVNNSKKPPSPSARQDDDVKTTRPTTRYSSPLPEDVTDKKLSSTTPPPRPRGRSDSFDIISNDDYPSLSAESISAELHHHHHSSSSALAIPTLSRFPPESLPRQQSHLISTANEDNDDDDVDVDDDDAPLLSLNAMSMNHANPNEAMLPPIPRINLQMRHSQQTSFPFLPRVPTETESYQSRRLFAVTQTQQTAVETARQSVVGFVPIHQEDSKEEDGEDEELRLE